MATISGAGFPRYTTYPVGSMEDTVRQYLHLPNNAPMPGGADEASLRRSYGKNSENSGYAGRRSQIIRAHTFTAELRDGTTGECRYERLGPRLHRFRYKDADGLDLPYQWFDKALDGTTADIERVGKELSAAAFADAVKRERTEYFCRASESATRKKRPEGYQMDAKRAKQLAGRYLLCHLLPSGKCFPASIATHDTLDEANAVWREREERMPKSSDPLVVACCNRLDRRWEMPRYNPLYAQTGKPGKGGR